MVCNLVLDSGPSIKSRQASITDSPGAEESAVKQHCAYCENDSDALRNREVQLFVAEVSRGRHFRVP